MRAKRFNFADVPLACSCQSLAKKNRPNPTQNITVTSPLFPSVQAFDRLDSRPNSCDSLNLVRARLQRVTILGLSICLFDVRTYERSQCMKGWGIVCIGGWWVITTVWRVREIVRMNWMGLVSVRERD